MEISVSHIDSPANPFEVRRPIALKFGMNKLNLTIEEAYQLRYAMDGALSVAMEASSSDLTPFETVRYLTP